jgi:hypothetical protein
VGPVRQIWVRRETYNDLSVEAIRWKNGCKIENKMGSIPGFKSLSPLLLGVYSMLDLDKNESLTFCFIF